jgi:N-acetylmuramate 1-kinase
MPRIELQRDFIKKHNIQGKQILLPADASFRSYSRIIGDNHNYILMDSPTNLEPVLPFIKIAKYLYENGFRSPNIHIEDVKNGFLLLEDLGDISFNKLLQNHDNPIILYKMIMDELIKLHQMKHEIDLPKYDFELYYKELNIFIEWYLQKYLQKNITDEQIAEFKNIWQKLIIKTEILPETLVLRDYHVDNLHYIEGGYVGILDFQDAVMGSPIYDIVSLLEDARCEVKDEVVKGSINLYLQAFPEIARDDFMMIYNILGAQRNLKILGVFVRKLLRDNSNFYLKFLSRVSKYLLSDISHPALLELKEWFVKNNIEISCQ